MSISIIAVLTAKPESIESIRHILEDLVVKSRQESGCIRYDALVGEKGITFVEEWASDDALKVHEKTEHFQKLVGEIEKNNLAIAVNFVKPLL